MARYTHINIIVILLISKNIYYVYFSVNVIDRS